MADSLLQPLMRPLMHPVLRLPTQFVSDGSLASQVAALFAAKSAIAQNTGDVEFLIYGDSTGNDPIDWPYQVGQDMAVRYPTHTVSYRLWNDSTNVYGAPVIMGTGSGANTIRIWNCSIPGATTEWVTGDKYAAAIEGLNPAAIIWNHGHNLTTLTDYVLRGRFIGPMEQIRLTYPTVPQTMIVQNPRLDDNLYEQIEIAIRKVVALRGDTGLIDMGAKFKASGKNPIYYADSVHPNALGQKDLNVATFWEGWDAAAYSVATLPAWLATAGTNILTNGDFSDFAGAVPAGWALAGNGVLTKETTIVAPGRPHSVKLVNGTTATNISQTKSATPYHGKKVTLAVYARIESGGDINTGQMRLFSNQTTNPVAGNSHYNRTGNIAWNGFRWFVIEGLDLNATGSLVGAFLSASSFGGTAGTVYFDRVILVEGEIPRNMA